MILNFIKSEDLYRKILADPTVENKDRAFLLRAALRIFLVFGIILGLMAALLAYAGALSVTLPGAIVLAALWIGVSIIYPFMELRILKHTDED